MEKKITYESYIFKKISDDIFSGNHQFMICAFFDKINVTLLNAK